MRRRPGIWLWVACAVLAGPTTLQTQAADIVIAGSETLEPVLRPFVEQHNRAQARRLRLDLQGSRPGLRDLESGRAAVALLLARPGEGWVRPGRRARPYAAQAAVVVVQAANPVMQLEFSQLAAIFGGGAGPSFRRWGDLGFGGEWVSRSIAPQWCASDHPLMGELFQHVVLRNPELGSAVVHHEKVGDALARLESDAGAIAVVTVGRVAWEGLRAVPIARAPGEVAFGPTAANVRAGDYPLALMVWLVQPEMVGPDSAEAAGFCESEAVASALAAAGWVPAFGGETR